MCKVKVTSPATLVTSRIKINQSYWKKNLYKTCHCAFLKQVKPHIGNFANSISHTSHNGMKYFLKEHFNLYLKVICIITGLYFTYINYLIVMTTTTFYPKRKKSDFIIFKNNFPHCESIDLIIFRGLRGWKSLLYLPLNLQWKK